MVSWLVSLSAGFFESSMSPSSIFLKLITSSKSLKSLTMRFPLLLTVTCLFAQYCVGQVQQCHRKDGSALPDLPCDPSANVSSCCGQGYECVTNLACKNRKGFLLVGSCTDPTWLDPSCPFRELSEYSPKHPSDCLGTFIYHILKANSLSRRGKLCLQLHPQHYSLFRWNLLSQRQERDLLCQ